MRSALAAPALVTQLLFSPFLTGALLLGQSPLTPASNMQIDVDPTQGALHYSRIIIPAGVTVTFTGNHPVQIRCDTDAVIDGQMSVDAGPPASSPTVSLGGPGAVATGTGAWGSTYTWSSPLGQLYCGYTNTYAGAGVHLGHYGSAMPFDLAGGSPSGIQMNYSEFGTTGQCWLTSTTPAGGGGGTLHLEAAGLITVRGSVTANGSLGANHGSGGSILLRAFGGVTVDSNASVTAVSGNGTANGIIRLDSYGLPASVLGTVTPAPTSIALPHLQEAHPPSIGTTWTVRVYSHRGDSVVLAASHQPGSFTLPPFGTIGIDVANSLPLGAITIPATGQDPFGVYTLPVPNLPALIGLDIFTAGLNLISTEPPRFTNTLQSTV